MSLPLVSILIPAYNAEKWIGHTIESALAQTWPRKEILVLDDGSSDGTLAVARRYASRGVKVDTQSNQGAATARNVLASRAQGEYIQWLDADDLLSPDKVERQMRIASEAGDPRVLLSSEWAYFMYRPAAAKFQPTALWEDLAPLEWMCRKWLHNLHMQTATWLVSRELTEAAGPWNPSLLGDDDGEYFARVVLASREVRFARQARVYYRVVGSARLSHIGRSDRKLEAHLRSMKLQIEYMRALDDGPRVRAAILSYLQTWLRHFYPERPDLVREMEALAAAVGGELQVPRVGWKYALIDKVLGRVAAKRCQLQYNVCKTSVMRAMDRALHAVDRSRARLSH